MTKQIKAWHFLREDRRFRYGDDNVAEVGYVYSVKPPIELCRWGLHASVRVSDAFRYATGPIVGRVLLSGEIKHGDDKLCATHREYLWIADASDALFAHARWCALQVIDLWDAPDVVRRYLESGKESFRNAARKAAWPSAQYAARHAADAAAAAADAARDAARDAQNADLETRLFAMGAPK